MGLEDPLASRVAPVQKAVISLHLIGGYKPHWHSLIGLCVWQWTNEGEKFRLKVTVALPVFFGGLNKVTKRAVTQSSYHEAQSIALIDMSGHVLAHIKDYLPQI